MTTETENNPPAFPRDHRYLGHNGMTLRDYFAGQALAGFAAAPDFVDPKPDVMAHESYRYADAMLAARSQVAA